jgi:hypothetical protein
MDVVDILVNACYNDEFPDDTNCLRTFMFDKCQNEEDASNLLGVWIGIAKMQKFKLDDLKKAVHDKDLYKYIVRMYESYHPDIKKHSYYYRWFSNWYESYE